MGNEDRGGRVSRPRPQRPAFAQLDNQCGESATTECYEQLESISTPLAGPIKLFTENRARAIGLSGSATRTSVGNQIPNERRMGSRSAKVYRGSRRRLQQLRLRGNASLELWLLVFWVLFLLLVAVPWMIKQGH
jgi:hypothetical protein